MSRPSDPGTRCRLDPGRPRAPRRPSAGPALLLALWIGGTTGCSGPTAPRAAFQEGLERWRAAGLDSYRFDFRLQCFCIPDAVRPVTVEVRGGEVVAVTFRDDGSPATAEQRDLFPTVDELFERVRRTLDQEPDSFLAEYDPELGYPSFVSADIDFEIADEEFSFRVEALEAVVP